MKFILIIFSLALSSMTLANDEKENSDFALGMLATGKLSGGCGIFKLQIVFQENTGLPGGNDFIARFWTTEAARLGMSLKEYAEACHKAIENYKKYQSIFKPASSK